jgi:fimbrial chaperone protein
VIRRTIATLVAVGFALCDSGAARAAPIDISPVTVILTPPARVAQITIKNPSEQPLRIQVFAFTWTDAPDGSIKMTPTHDVIVFPQLVTIPLFGTQQIRAAFVSPPAAFEKTYRILIDVLPSLSDVDQLSGPGVLLSIRTRFTVPIFQEPLVPRMSGKITTASAKRGTIQFTIANSGNTHLGGDEIRIIGRNDAGRVIFSEPFRGWYVLTESKRTFSFRAPQDGCGDVRSVSIAPPSDANVPAKDIEVESGVCGA